MMKKHNVVLLAAIMAAFGANTASAQSSITLAAAAPKFALEIFKGTAPATSVVLKNAAIVSGTSIPAGSNVTIALTLANGATFDTLAATAATVPAGGAAATLTFVNSGGATLVASTLTTASNADTLLVSIPATGTAVGLGAVLSTVSTIKVHAAGLATAGSVTATSTIYTGNLTAMPAAGTAALDATSAATTVATSAQGIDLAAAATAAGTQKIDLTATPVASKFNAGTATVATLGTVTATNGTAVGTDGATAYVVGAKTLAATVTAPAGFFAALSTTKKIWLEAGGCTAGAAAVGVLAGTPSTPFATAAAASAATSVTLGATGNPVSGTAYNVCMEVNGTTAMIEGTPAIAVTLGAAAAQDSQQSVAATNLMALAYNGQTVDVRNYVPAAVAGGWTQYLRVINTGAVAAPVSIAVIDETTGTVGASATLITSLPAGAVTNLTSTQIEAVTGAIGQNARPRLRITAPTNGLEVQNILFTPNGSFTAMQGKE